MVKFDLETEASVVSRVAGALVADHRTPVAVVAVTQDRGVITLSGQVDDPNTREAAAQIAARQPGVVEVINEELYMVPNYCVFAFLPRGWELRTVHSHGILKPFYQPSRGSGEAGP